MPPRPYTFVINIGKGTVLYTTQLAPRPAPHPPFRSIHVISSCLVRVLRVMEWGALKLRRILYTGLESVTQGLARATSHRVLAPAAGTSPRYSIPFFQNIRQDLRLSEHVLQRTSLADSDSRDFISYPPCMWAVPTEVLKLKGRRGELRQTDCESDI